MLLRTNKIVIMVLDLVYVFSMCVGSYFIFALTCFIIFLITCTNSLVYGPFRLCNWPYHYSNNAYILTC